MANGGWSTEPLGVCPAHNRHVFLLMETKGEIRFYRINMISWNAFLCTSVTGDNFCWGSFGTPFYNRQEAIQIWIKYLSSFSNKNWLQEGF